MKRRESPSSIDPLDELLARAQWAEPTTESTQRLTAYWGRLRRHWRIRLQTLSAMAAAVLMVVGVWAWLEGREQRPSERPSATAVEQATTAGTFTLLPASPTPAQQPPVVGKEPTLLQVAIVRGAERREREQKLRAVTAAALPERRAPVATEAELAEQIAAADGRVSRELAASFCERATPSSLPLVLRLARDPHLRPITIDAVARLADVQTLATFARRDVPSDERRRLCAALLGRGSDQSLQHYLQLVADVRTRADALAAVDGIKGPPTEPLLATLRGPRADLRVAAALALGRINGPVLTRRLIAMVAAGESRQEAFLALASSRGSEARSFVRRAAASDPLAAQARSALAQSQYQ